MPIVDLCLTASSGSGCAAGVRLGEPLLDAYLEFVAARCRPNTVLATAFDLKVFFTVVAKPPAEVTPADVLGFVTAQHAGADTATAVALVDGGDGGVSARHRPGRTGPAVSAPERLASWPQIEASAPVMAATMRRYLEQIACSLRPGSVHNADQALRAFAGFLHEATPEVVTVAAVTRGHIQAYKPWLAARVGRDGPRVSVNTRAHRLGTLRMFFFRLAEWDWPDRPERVPILFGDLPRQDKPLPKALDDPAAATPPPRSSYAPPRTSPACSSASSAKS
jgi:hypothetical protein